PRKGWGKATGKPPNVRIVTVKEVKRSVGDIAEKHKTNRALDPFTRRKLHLDVKRKARVLFSVSIHVVIKGVHIRRLVLALPSPDHLNGSGPAMVDDIAAIQGVVLGWLHPSARGDGAGQQAVASRFGHFPEIFPKGPGIRSARAN